MINYFLKKYWFFIFIFILYHVLLYVNKVNLNNPVSYINFILYFITFLIIHENLQKTNFNKTIVYLYFYFYGYLSILMSLGVLTRNIESVNYYFFVYIDLFLKLLILLISLYLVFYSFRLWQKKSNQKLIFSLSVALIIIIINYKKFLLNPSILGGDAIWTEYAVRNYIASVLSLFALLIFWYRYYQKYCVVSEYLNSVIFLFTLSNIVEALHFIAFQLNAQIFYYGQLFTLGLNMLMLLVWYLRWMYLNSDISIENERYLKNFQFLNGFVSKPKKSLFSKIIPVVSIRYLIISLFILAILIIGLFLVKKITFYLLLNTVFILLAIAMAVFFSFSSIKRDWHNQVGILFKKTKNE